MYEIIFRVILLRSLLFLALVKLGTCNFKLLILHTTDMHSRYDAVNIHKNRCQDESQKTCYGGFARIRAAVDDLKGKAEARGVPTIYLDAGDVFGESVYYTEYKWELAAKMMNLLAPDAISLGNHEFDGGVTGLASYIRDLEMPVLCTNMVVSKEPDMESLAGKKLFPSTVLELKGTKVGIIGYTKPHILPKNMGKVQVLDEIKSLNKEAQRLKKEKGAKIIIALGHAGYYRDIEIAKKIQNINIIVGGRSHFFIYSGTPPSSEKPRGPYPTIVEKGKNKILIVSASFGTKYLGQIEVEFNDKGDIVGYTGQPILLTGDMPQNQPILDALEPYKSEIKSKYQYTIGTTEVLLDGKGSVCRFKECNIGNMVTDAFVEFVNKHYSTEDGQKVTHIGLLQSGDIAASLSPKSEFYTGDITLEDLIIILPFSRHLEVMKLKGSVLRGVLESAVNTYSPDKGGMFRACLMQVSGLRLQYDLSKKKGQRLTKVQVAPDYKELDDAAYYNVVMPDFLANGGDGIQCTTNLQGQERAMTLGEDAVDYTVVAEYIKEHSPITGEAYQVQGRIEIIEPKKSESDGLLGILSKFTSKISLPTG